MHYAHDNALLKNERGRETIETLWEMDTSIANICAYLLFWVKCENAYGV